MAAETVQEAITPMRQALQLDGADLEFEDERDGTAYFRLILTDDTACKECVMAQEILEQVVLVNLSKAQPHITTVAIDDPRNSDAYAADEETALDEATRAKPTPLFQDPQRPARQPREGVHGGQRPGRSS